MLTIGLDVASQPSGTAACWVEWRHREARITRIAGHLTDAEIRLILDEQAAKTGIDVPLGWPDAFVQALSRHHHGQPWDEHDVPALAMRATDHAVREATGRWPLSISTDRIAYPAMRMARILAGIDRSGDGPIVEVYPAAAQRIWGLAASGYKGARGAAVRAQLVAALQKAAPWLHGTDEEWACLQRSDHALDALVASLVARAKVMGLCREIPEDARDLASLEGWIALPIEGSLPRLAERSRDHHWRKPTEA